MKRLFARMHRLTPVGRILAVAALLHVALFGMESRKWVKALFKPSAETPVERRGPFTKGADFVGYYSWLRSPLVDGDFQFRDELAATFAKVPGSEASFSATGTGYVGNHWSVGPALVWAPAVVPVHAALRLMGERSPWPADGYSPPYQLAVGFTTLLLSLLTLGFAYRIACFFATPVAAAASAALVTLGTTVVVYGAVEVSMAHGPAAAVLSGFALYWLRTFGETRVVRWVILGGLLGFACLMRWQLATFVLLPVGEALWQVSRSRGVATLFARLALAGVAAAVVFLPQLAAKQLIYGTPSGGVHDTAKNWFDPALWQVLGSTDRSLFYWTPVTLPALAGLVCLGLRQRREGAILAAAVAIQIYTVSALMGSGVYLGWSFGFRLLTESCVLMAPGLAFLFDRGAVRRVSNGVAIAGGTLVAWNLLLLGIYRYCLFHEHGLSPSRMLELVGTYVGKRVEEVAILMTLCGVLAYCLAKALGERRAARALPETIEAGRKAA